MWIFKLSAILLAYLAMNIYTGIRVFDSLKYFFPFFGAFVFWPIYIVLCYSLILVMLLRLDRVFFIRQAGMYSLPFFAYFFFALITLDALRLGLQHLTIATPAPNLPVIYTGIAAGIAVLFMVYGTLRARKIHTTRYEIHLDKGSTIESPLRIALISDLHIGVTVGRKWIADIVDAVNRAEPHIVCIAGDIFDNDIGAVRDREGVAEELRRLNAPLGVFASQGNHDVDKISWRASANGEAAAGRIKEFLKEAGITFLLDEAILVADSFYILGRRDASPIGSRHTRKTAADLAEDLDRSKPLIFLDHQPIDFPAKDAAGADLILSGHTHRGQIFPGSIVTKRMFKEAGAVHYGYWRGRNAQGVVTSGAGIWGPPMRIGSISEVVVINAIFGQ